MKDIVDVLKEFGELAHWTKQPADEPHGNLNCPPIITWRYERPSREIAEFFRRVVSAYPGTMAWDFSSAERMWVLMPSRINEYSKSHGNLGGLAVAHELTLSEPEFGRRANADLPLLTAYIQYQLENPDGESNKALRSISEEGESGKRLRVSEKS